MNKVTLALVIALLGTANAYADLKPDVLDCNAKKAARNAAMEATVGISGNCDTSKAVKKTTDNAAEKAKDAVDIDRNHDALPRRDDDSKGLLNKRKNKD